MIDLLIRIGIAVAAGWAANEAVKLVTKRSIPQHLSRWWNQLIFEVRQWVEENENSDVVKIVGRICAVIDSGVIAAKKRVLFNVMADEGNGEVKVLSRRISAEQAIELFPELANSTSVDLTHEI